MKATNYKVVPYTHDNLVDLLSELSGSRRDDVARKVHSVYFREYFGELRAQTIIAELDYVDRDYLEDFAAYYVRCFTPPRAHCSRLHFFRTSFRSQTFTRFLTGSISREAFLKRSLNDEAYLGFLVVKPLDQTLIGRTCLRTYSDAASGRHFPSLRRYDAHVFGATLSVESLAFQEQDAEVARCATAALWAVLQGTAIRFGHAVPTPVEITRNALAVHGNRSRTFPARDGLTVEQLADAVRRVGLEPYCVSVGDREILQTESYAYLRAGIPALLGIALIDPFDADGTPCKPGRHLGFHAVALTGYHLSRGPAVPLGNSGLLLRASRIDKFYVHDDQIGPFARMRLSPLGEKVSYRSPDDAGDPVESEFLDCSWPAESRDAGSMKAIPETLLVPLYPKMRIPFQDALEATAGFDSAVRELEKLGHIPLDEPLEWDIFLTTAADLKKDILATDTLRGAYSRDILTSSMPRFVWRSIGLCKGTPRVELLIDATDIVQGRFFLRANEHDQTFLKILRDPTAVQFATSFASRTILEWFASN